MRVLLLEDETMLRTTIKEYLEEQGCDVLDVAQGDQAVSAIQNEDFDAMALDICVPEVDGYKVLEAIRAKDEQAPVIFITALTEINEIAKAYELGCTDYLKKPFKLQELWLRLNQALKLCKKEAGFISLSENLRYDKKRKKLFNGTSEVGLTKKHSQILSLLVSQIGVSVPLEQFRLAVWGRDDIDDATIRTEINRLRKIAPQLIVKNFKGIGYKLERNVNGI